MVWGGMAWACICSIYNHSPAEGLCEDPVVLRTHAHPLHRLSCVPERLADSDSEALEHGDACVASQRHTAGFSEDVGVRTVEGVLLRAKSQHDKAQGPPWHPRHKHDGGKALRVCVSISPSWHTGAGEHAYRDGKRDRRSGEGGETVAKRGGEGREGLSSEGCAF